MYILKGVVMSIDVNPALFRNDSGLERVTPTITSENELEGIRKRETKVEIEGDIFTYSGVSFKSMTQKELLHEEIDLESLNLTTSTTTKNKTDDRIIIAFRDPEDSEKIIAYKLDKEVVDDLKQSFSSDNFFQREDGILRLNNEVENYVAGWLLDIKKNRGYEKADVNANGRIDKNEEGNLNIGFDHNTKYDYLGDKIDYIHTYVGERKYQKYSDTMDGMRSSMETAYTPNDILDFQSLKFENSIEKELSHTLELDKDKDGTITLKEGQADFTPKGKNAESYLIEKIKWNHNRWVEHSNIILDWENVKTREVPTMDIVTQEEREEALLKSKEASKKFNENNNVKEFIESLYDDENIKRYDKTEDEFSIKV